MLGDPVLATLAADPERVNDLPREALPALIGEAEALRARLWARLQTVAVVTVQTPVPDPARSGGPDRMLKVGEAAERLGVDRRWLYRRAGTLPFAKKVGGHLRFSENGIARWLDLRGRG